MKKACLYCFCIFLVSCQTVTISPQGRSFVYSSNPVYKSSLHFFLAGIVGEYSINVEDICGERAVEQMQTQSTFLDGFLYVLTLGIYTPKTVRVWCGKKKKKETSL